jgi:hypothetical protein
MKTILAIFIAACIVGSFDVAEAERQQAEYCEAIHEGAPAYRGIEVCK